METRTCTNGHTMTGIGFDTCPECEASWAIEHCSEPNCPECNIAAYNRGKQDEFKRIITILQNNINYCKEVNGLPYCKNCGLDLDELSGN